MARVEIGSRARTQPPPPRIVHAALTDPDQDPRRPWLHLLDDEQRPRILDYDAPSSLTWSSLWPARPDAQVRFDIDSDGGSGTSLRWTLTVEEPVPPDALVGHMRFRLNRLINAELRYSFGQ